MEQLTQREIAAEVLEAVFRDRRRVPIAEIVAAGALRGVSRRTLRRAADQFGITEVHNGNKPGFWQRQD